MTKHKALMGGVSLAQSTGKKNERGIFIANLKARHEWPKIS